MVKVWKLSYKCLLRYELNTTFWRCSRFWPLAPLPGIDPGVMECRLPIQDTYGISMNAFWPVVVKIWTSRKLYRRNTKFWWCTRFWPLAPPPGMDPGVRCCTMKANHIEYLCSSMNAFWWVVVKLWSSRKLYRRNIIFFRCSRFWPLAPPPARTMGSSVMEWKLTLLGTYGPSMKSFWWMVVKIWTSRKLIPQVWRERER